MPVLQIILNLPFLVPGFGMKILFFSRREWAGSMWQESKMGSRSVIEIKKSEFHMRNLGRYARIQLEHVVEYNLQIYGIKSLCRSDSLLFRNYFSC